MINAVGVDSHTAAELTYPALIVEKHLDARLKGLRPSPPSSALWAIEIFLRNAIDNARRRNDPVASAVSYALADSTLRATSPAVTDTESVLRQFLQLLDAIQNEAPLPKKWKQVGTNLREFLASLRERGQGESYNRFRSCI